MTDSHTSFPGLAEVAATEHLAVVSDFDGTLAGFAKAIYEVEPEPRSLAATTITPEVPTSRR